MPSKFLFDGEEPENSVGELQEQTYQEEEDVNANKPCVTAREGIYFFFREAGAVVGHLTETEICILCRASELYFGSPVHQV